MHMHNMYMLYMLHVTHDTFLEPLCVMRERKHTQMTALSRVTSWSNYPRVPLQA